MATPIVMPQMGYDMREGTVVRWLKGEGDTFTRGEVIAEIETDKATIEMPAYVAGILGKIVVEPGRKVPVGELIAVITDPGEEVPPLETLSVRTVPGASVVPSTPPAEAVTQPSPPPSGRVSTELRASPIARRLAKERGIDLTKVTGTGPGARVTEADVLSYEQRAAATPAPTEDSPPTAPTAERVPLSRMRQAIARVTTLSKRETPHFYITTDIDMTAALALRRQINDSKEEVARVSINDMIVKACAKTLQTYPKFNSSFREDHLELHSTINIGIAIALEEGLIVAAVPDCHMKSLGEIARASRDLLRRAEGGTLHPQEYESTFSVSNLGMFDVDSFAAIVYPPNAAVVAVGTVKVQPVVRDGQITTAHMMKATISVDHRVADGAEAARFMVELKRLLEHPAILHS